MNSTKICELRKKYGEAFYLLDSRQFENNFLELKNAFSYYYPKTNIAYSYKTNYIPELCKVVRELGGYAEVVSEMELDLALRVGNSPKEIIWNGPVKNRDRIEDFLLNGGIVNIDSFDEFEYIKSLVICNANTTFRLGIRVNFDVGDGVVSRFGMDSDSEDFAKVVNFIHSADNVVLAEVQCHFAKRQIDYWPARVEGMINVLDKYNLSPERVDLGGGMFGKMADSLKSQFSTVIPSYQQYAEVAAKVFHDKFGDNGPELLIEPGSALVGDCMKFLCTVKTIKKVRDNWFATVLGSQKNISMSGVNPPIEVIRLGNNPRYFERIDIVGYTCIENDVIYKGYEGELSEDDIVVIGNCGSYSIVMKPPFILPNFPVIDISRGEEKLIKRKESFSDIFGSFVW